VTFAELLADASTHVVSAFASPIGIVAHVAGLAAAVLVIVSAFVKTMLPLRWLAIAGNVGFLVYGALRPAFLPMIVAATLLPINVYRAFEMIRLTRRVQAAEASRDLSGLWLKPYMKTRRLAAGETLFRRGDAADHLYFLVAGRMELVEIGQALEPGKIFGEIAFFSPSGRRTHTARCVEDCRVLMIDESTVKQLYFQNPSFGFHLIGLVAGRLSADVERIERKLAREGLAPPTPPADCTTL